MTLLKDFVVCEEGSVLSPSQAKILELLDYKLATFKLFLRGRWTKGEGFEQFKNDCDYNEVETEN